MIDTKKIRKDFPMYRKEAKFNDLPLHYLDNSATTFKPYSVIEAEKDYEENYTANTRRADYALANEADKRFDEARNVVARFLNCLNEEVCFTSGTTMSLNEIAYGLIPQIKADDEIVISYEEHASNVLPWFQISKITGAKIKFVPLENNRITVDNLKKVISSHTKVVSLASVSNVLGYTLPVKELCQVAHSVNAIYIADAAQEAPHQKIDVKDTDVDFLAFSGHKMLGPTGIGVLYGKKKQLEKLYPLLYGGEMNARFHSDLSYSLDDLPYRMEAGTQNISGVVGLAEAIKYLEKIGFDNIHEHERKLHDYAIEKLKENKNIIIYNQDCDNGIITFNVKDIFPQDVATYLSSKGVFVRSGNHCAKILPEILKTPGTIRASLYLYNDKDDIDALVEALKHSEDFLDVFFN